MNLRKGTYAGYNNNNILIATSDTSLGPNRAMNSESQPPSTDDQSLNNQPPSTDDQSLNNQFPSIDDQSPYSQIASNRLARTSWETCKNCPENSGHIRVLYGQATRKSYGVTVAMSRDTRRKSQDVVLSMSDSG